MKFGLNVMLVRPDSLAATARAADDMGFDCIWIPDHLVFGEQIASRYPYNDDGSAPFKTSTPFMDPLATLAYLAAVTERIKLGTAIYILPLRNPVVTAKVAATVDVLSAGRLLLGIGVGWMQEEFHTAGEDFRTRGARTDEAVHVMKALWTNEEAEFAGRFYSLGPVRLEPKPVQIPHPPLIFGGESEAALRRAANLGDGWIGMRHTATSAAAKIQTLRRYRDEAGRLDDPFEITVLGGPTITVQDARDLADAGVDRINVYPWRRNGRPGDDLERFRDEVVSKL